MKTKTIKQAATFHCSPLKVYEVLMDERKHAQLTGAPATISRKVGGNFSIYGAYATGKNIELITGKKIVQTWRSSDWPENEISVVTFNLQETKKGTRLSFIQTGVPEDQYESIKQGWIDFYWEPMKQLLESK